MSTVTAYITAAKWAVPDDREAVEQIIEAINKHMTTDLGFVIKPLSYDEFLDADWEPDPDDESADGFMADEFADALVTIWEFTNFVMNRVGTNAAILNLGAVVGDLLIGTDTIADWNVGRLDL